MRKNNRIVFFTFFLVLVGLLWVTILLNVNDLLISFGIVLISGLFFIVRFEKKKIEARELVLLAVLAAIAAVGRIPFASIPSVQPTTFVIMMSGFVFGAESGFMIGAVAALASNMILGQGPWTPWQMVAWGLVGLTSGLFNKSWIMSSKWGRIAFGIVWGFVFGWIMNIWSLFAFIQDGINIHTIVAYAAGSALFDFMHSISNVIFLLLFAESWIKILNRFKSKYGLLITR
ncbi:ECF transporter S component [Neobacillus sp. D3-1R]|uniref:ECF transporter S component n=1 Tax=Neobacillus sp. D3-1R TaxID=3445778 RepID=UPI003F9F9988